MSNTALVLKRYGSYAEQDNFKIDNLPEIKKYTAYPV
jgi:hypothetical protein